MYAGETARVQASITDEDGYPTSPVPESVTVELRDEDEESTILAESDMALVIEDAGTLTAASTTLLTDSTQAWAPGFWRGACVRLTDGAAFGEQRRVRDNTATTLTLDTKQVVDEEPVGPLVGTPVSGDSYELHRTRYRKSIDIPDDLEDETVIAVIRARTTTGANPYLSVEKIPLRVEGKAV